MPISAYEEERNQRIASNKELLGKLGLDADVAALAGAAGECSRACPLPCCRCWQPALEAHVAAMYASYSAGKRRFERADVPDAHARATPRANAHTDTRNQPNQPNLHRQRGASARSRWRTTESCCSCDDPHARARRRSSSRVYQQTGRRRSTARRGTRMHKRLRADAARLSARAERTTASRHQMPPWRGRVLLLRSLLHTRSGFPRRGRGFPRLWRCPPLTSTQMAVQQVRERWRAPVVPSGRETAIRRAIL